MEFEDEEEGERVEEGGGVGAPVNCRWRSGLETTDLRRQKLEEREA